jgi:2-hydroxy-3-keto-5-methylthiopentenyl-1-phosphate phosphatase
MNTSEFDEVSMILKSYKNDTITYEKAFEMVLGLLAKSYKEGAEMAYDCIPKRLSL